MSTGIGQRSTARSSAQLSSAQLSSAGRNDIARDYLHCARAYRIGAKLQAAAA